MTALILSLIVSLSFDSTHVLKADTLAISLDSAVVRIEYIDLTDSRAPILVDTVLVERRKPPIPPPNCEKIVRDWLKRNGHAQWDFLINSKP